MITQADYHISKDGQSIDINQRLIQLQLIDKRGLESDQLTITISDSDEEINMPQMGATLTLAIGYKKSPLINKGTFIVDEISYSIMPNQLTITARSASVKGMKTQHERSFHQKTIQDIFDVIAIDSDLNQAVSANLGSILLEHIDQTGESNASFLTRLGENFDAIVTIKNGYLIATNKGAGITANGQTLPTITLRRSEISQMDYSHHKQQYTEVQACWNETKHSKRNFETVGNQTGESKQLRHTYPTATLAKQAAQTELNKLNREAQTCTITLSCGRAEIIPEMSIKTSGIKTSIDNVTWLVKEVTHSINSAGYKTDLSLELV